MLTTPLAYWYFHVCLQVLCSERLPAWAPALSASASAAVPSAPAGGAAPAQPGGGLLPRMLVEACDALIASHALLPDLEGAYPLMCEAVAGAAGHLAASLQHVASAPGLCVGAGGPALRGACAQQCVRLRDALMPSA